MGWAREKRIESGVRAAEVVEWGGGKREKAEVVG
jgi:hypothetical protein